MSITDDRRLKFRRYLNALRAMREAIAEQRKNPLRDHFEHVVECFDELDTAQRDYTLAIDTSNQRIERVRASSYQRKRTEDKTPLRDGTTSH